MRGMSIGEVARKMGLRSSAIRYYEKLGLIPKAPRLSGRRRYDERVLERLAMVRFAKHVGFSIAEIKVLLRGVDGRPPPERWHKLAAEKVAQVDAFVAQARTIRKLLSETLDFQCPKLVERGRALPAATARPALRLKHPARSARWTPLPIRGQFRRQSESSKTPSRSALLRPRASTPDNPKAGFGRDWSVVLQQ